MELLQTYEVAVADRDATRAFHLFIAPGETVRDPALLRKPGRLAEELGLRPVKELPSAAFLLPAVTAVLQEGRAKPPAFVPSLLGTEGYSDADPDVSAIAQHVIFAEVIPYRDGPRGKRSLVSLNDISHRPGTKVSYCLRDGVPVLAMTGPGGFIVGGGREAAGAAFAHGVARLSGGSVP
jgi:hypothetical protein